MRVNQNIKHNGFTLIELMIAIMLGLIVIGGALSIYISTIRSSSDVVKSARLNYDLDSAMQLMVNDIRRAGYWGGAVSGSDAANNSFTQVPAAATATDIQIRNVAAPTTVVSEGDCILYTYDGGNGDGVVDTNEYYGFRLNGTELEIRTTGTAATAGDCNGAGQWENIIDENNVLVTNLQFSFLAIAVQAAVANVQPALPALMATSRCINITADTVTNALNCATAANPVTAGDNIAQKRVVNIHLSGYVNGDMSVVKSFSTSVQVSNDRVYTAS